MTLHCAGRLGVLSWIYEQRRVIAFELGLSGERPIAECGIAFLDDGLVVIGGDNDETIFQASAIDLFFDFTEIRVQAEFSFIRTTLPHAVQHHPEQRSSSIFHPPSIA